MSGPHPTPARPGPPAVPGRGAAAADAPSPRPRPGPAATSRTGRAALARVEETSAGGLVVDRSGSSPRAALIARLDRRGRLAWSLPKGHLEAGETPEQAAVREVEEETGIRSRVLAPLGTIDFWFVADARRIHKTVHHHLLEALSVELSDADVEVVEVRWFGLDRVHDVLAYADERRLLRTVPRLLAQVPPPPPSPE